MKNTYLLCKMSNVCDGTEMCVHVACNMHGDSAVHSVQQFHLLGMVSTSSPCSFSFVVMDNNVGSALQSAARQNQTLYGNDCISSATTSPLILLFIQWSQSSGLLEKWIHIYASESVVIAGLVDTHQGRCKSVGVGAAQRKSLCNDIALNSNS